MAYWPGNPVQNNVESPAQTSRAVPYTRIAIPAETSPTAPSGNTDGPLVLDIKPFYHVLANHPAGILDSLVGRPVIDGLPFEIGGQAFLYSQTVADRGEMDLPDTFKGIPVGRKFDELHLIHHTRWPGCGRADGGLYMPKLRQRYRSSISNTLRRSCPRLVPPAVRREGIADRSGYENLSAPSACGMRRRRFEYSRAN